MHNKPKTSFLFRHLKTHKEQNKQFQILRETYVKERGPFGFADWFISLNVNEAKCIKLIHKHIFYHTKLTLQEDKWCHRVGTFILDDFHFQVILLGAFTYVEKRGNSPVLECKYTH
jgi:hypothetical protein